MNEQLKRKRDAIVAELDAINKQIEIESSSTSIMANVITLINSIGRSDERLAVVRGVAAYYHI